MEPSATSASTGKRSNQDPTSEVNHTNNDRAALTKERDDLRAENVTLKETVQLLQKQVAELQPAKSKKARTSPLAQDHLEMAQPMRLIKVSAEGVPDEVLLEIFGLLQDTYNRFHRENALRRVIDPPSGSRPWLPAGLQLVCRRWRDLARPLFYRDQVAVDCRNPFFLAKLAKLARTLEIDDALPFPRLLVLFSDEKPDTDQVRRVQNANKASTPIKVIASTSSWNSFDSGVLGMSSCIVVPRDDCAFGSGGSPTLYHTFIPIQITLQNNLGGGHRVIRDLVLRFSHPHNVTPVLADILRQMDLIVYLPRLRFDLPFVLPTAVLDPAALTLAGILKHPSHEVGRAFLLSRDNTVKRISFGTYSEADATALRARIESLGDLNVVVQVDVLEP